jgi:hypothetical protein
VPNSYSKSLNGRPQPSVPLNSRPQLSVPLNSRQQLSVPLNRQHRNVLNGPPRCSVPNSYSKSLNGRPQPSVPLNSNLNQLYEQPINEP